MLRYSDPKLRRIWTLTVFKKYSSEQLSQKNARLDMREKEFASCFMGCNNISYNYFNKKSDQIYFKGGLSTSKACEDMQLEEDFNQTMQLIKKYRIEGNILTLMTEEGEKIVLTSTVN